MIVLWGEGITPWIYNTLCTWGAQIIGRACLQVPHGTCTLDDNLFVDLSRGTCHGQQHGALLMATSRELQSFQLSSASNNNGSHWCHCHCGQSSHIDCWPVVASSGIGLNQGGISQDVNHHKSQLRDDSIDGKFSHRNNPLNWIKAAKTWIFCNLHKKSCTFWRHYCTIWIIIINIFKSWFFMKGEIIIKYKYCQKCYWLCTIGQLIHSLSSKLS